MKERKDNERFLQGKFIWIVIAMCGLTGSSLGICTSCVGVFYNSVTADLGILKGTFALHATLALLANAITSLFIPKLLEKFRFKTLLITGTILAVVSTALMAVSRQVVLFYILGIIRGIGCAAFANVPVTMVLNNWFKKSIGVCTSLAFSFSGITGAVCSPILSSCIGAIGWEKSYLIMALFILVFNGIAILIPFKFRPEDEGLEAYGADSVSAQAKAAAGSFSKGDRRYIAVTSGLFLLYAVAFTVLNAITNIPQYYTVYVSEVGLSETVGAMLISCAMLGNVLSKLVLGVLNDNIGGIKACCLLTAVNALALIGIALLPVHQNVAVIGACSVLFGTCYALGSVGTPLMCRQYFGTENYGHLFPVASFMLNAGLSLSLTLIGYVYDFIGRYDYIVAACAVLDVFMIMILIYVGRATAKKAAA